MNTAFLLSLNLRDYPSKDRDLSPSVSSPTIKTQGEP